ncbi:hypothetical protein B0H19DRAFT_1270730 [Mycena capillaripes]|nr:hypothetical protein B0H19DRAFT_1270730 [Mycena capillaripes]
MRSPAAFARPEAVLRMLHAGDPLPWPLSPLAGAPFTCFYICDVPQRAPCYAGCAQSAASGVSLSTPPAPIPWQLARTAETLRPAFPLSSALSCPPAADILCRAPARFPLPSRRLFHRRPPRNRSLTRVSSIWMLLNASCGGHGRLVRVTLTVGTLYIYLEDGENVRRGVHAEPHLRGDGIYTLISPFHPWKRAP